MNFRDYQQLAQKTDQVPFSRFRNDKSDMIVPLLGLAGEAGELLSEYKKHLRDGDSYIIFKERVSEELGDLLWYIANVASKFNLNLEEVAKKNIKKVNSRWNALLASNIIFDESYPEHEKLPRKFKIELREVDSCGKKKIRMLFDGRQIGDDLTDNADDPDGYRFHDVFHLAYVAILGWSPVIRKLMFRKRRSNLQVDEVQDGGRAQVIDEGISALIFGYAKDHNWFENIDEVDYELIRTIKGMTSTLEVSQRSAADWKKAILVGFAVWREVLKNNGGHLFVDQDKKELIYLFPPTYDDP